jgi:hypothetical protein
VADNWVVQKEEEMEALHGAKRATLGFPHLIQLAEGNLQPKGDWGWRLFGVRFAVRLWTMDGEHLVEIDVECPLLYIDPEPNRLGKCFEGGNGINVPLDADLKLGSTELLSRNISNRTERRGLLINSRFSQDI